MALPVSPVVRWLARAASRIFYRIDCIGAPPADGAALLLPNHPNALLDPAIVWATAGRDVRFLAKSTLFGGPFRPLLAGAGAIPVYRRLDQGVDTSRNTETFAAVDAALADGDAVCIFPEGISHSSGRLEPLRTGAARMALSAERQGTRVALVPVGLNFDRKVAFRSRVTVVYGAPFSASDLVTDDEADQAERVRALTERIASHMRRLLVEADPQADAALVDRVDRLYAAARGRPQDPEERLARRRIIAAGIQRLRTGDPARYDELLLRLRRYDQRLRRFGLRDRHLDWRVSPADALRFAVRELALAVVLMPLAALGFVLFFVPYHLTAFAARRFTRETDVVATAQVVAGALVYGGWFGAIGWALWRLSGPAAALAIALLLPALAVLCLLAIERETAVIDAVRAWVLLHRARDETRERLRRSRTDLAHLLEEVREMLDLE
jgi:glycerol-3-phosphate O-acyltransferase / dihydroxyacetone phosphate acyltransferase